MTHYSIKSSDGIFLKGYGIVFLAKNTDKISVKAQMVSIVKKKVSIMLHMHLKLIQKE